MILKGKRKFLKTPPTHNCIFSDINLLKEKKENKNKLTPKKKYKKNKRPFLFL